MNDLLQFSSSAAQLVPASYAEKAMASLMQLHSELMDEKERRVELHRRLMEREQAIAELKMYVKLLEEKQQPVAPALAQPLPVSVAAVPVEPQQVKPSPPPLPRRPPPMPVQVGIRLRPEGWKVW